MLNFQKTLLLFFVFSCTLNIGFSQEEATFPEKWEGSWVGTLEIHNASGLVQSLPMELHILPIDTSENYTWSIVYGENKEEGLRAYELEVLDAAKGYYRIDEKNSILLEGYFLGDKFIQVFSVNGSLLYTSTEMLNPDVLLWEIIAGSMKPVSTTGGVEFEGEEIPEVQAYPMTVLQRARLYRQ